MMRLRLWFAGLILGPRWVIVEGKVIVALRARALDLSSFVAQSGHLSWRYNIRHKLDDCVREILHWSGRTMW